MRLASMAEIAMDADGVLDAPRPPPQDRWFAPVPRAENVHVTAVQLLLQIPMQAFWTTWGDLDRA